MDKEVIMSTIKVKQIKSRIGFPKDQRKTLDSLGLHKLNHVSEVKDNPSVRGMIEKVKHLVAIVD